MRRLLALTALVVVAVIAFLTARSREAEPLEPAPNEPVVSRAGADLDAAIEPAARGIAEVGEVASADPIVPAEIAVEKDPGCTVTFALEYDDARTGKPVDRPQLSCTDERGRGVDERVVDARTLVAANVRPGPHRVHAFVPGHEPAYARFEVLAGERSKRVDLRFEPAVATASRPVLVRWQTEDGAPFVPALAHAWRAEWRGFLLIRHERGGGSGFPVPSPKNAFTRAESVGRSRPGAPMDSIAIVTLAVGAGTVLEACLDDRAVATVRVAPHEDEVVIRTSVDALLADLGLVRGCVVGADDRVPFAGARVAIEWSADRMRDAKAESGTTGCFSIDGAASGAARLRVEGGGASILRDIAIEAGGVLDLGEIALPTGCSFRVRIADGSGRPVRGARILCASAAELRSQVVRHSGTAKHVSSDRAEVSTAPVDDAVLLVEARGHGLTAVRLPACGRRGEELEVRLRAGVEVVFDLGLGDRTQSIRIATADGTPLGDLTTTSTGIAVAELAPGEYVVHRARSDVRTSFRVDGEPLVVRME